MFDPIKEAYKQEYARLYTERILKMDVDYWYTRCEFLAHEVDVLKAEIASLTTVREEIDAFVKEEE